MQLLHLANLTSSIYETLVLRRKYESVSHRLVKYACQLVEGNLDSKKQARREQHLRPRFVKAEISSF